MAVPDPSELMDNDDSSKYEVDPDPKSFAKLELKGTSTVNPKQPRTTAAGYDMETQTLTVVFRDGTWWNYYDVPEDMWFEFKNAQSKGRYLKGSGLDNWHSMGPVDMSDMRPAARATLNQVVRASSRAQKATGGMQVTGDTRQFKSWYGNTGR
jgi:hypothetical protein